MKQLYDNYTPSDQLVWKTLFDRQKDNLKTKGSTRYMECLEKLSPVLHAERIPDFDALNTHLGGLTGWNIEVVPGLIPVEEFFLLLSQRKFCSSTWLRRMDQLDYLEEPDMFHDIFGHVPLLADEAFANFMEAYGRLGVVLSSNKTQVIQLQRLYWFTIEFGLIREFGERRVYGAGIASSFGETNHSLSDGLEVRPFDMQEIINRPFHTDRIQEVYFELGSFEQLFEGFEEMKGTVQVR